MSNGPGNVFVGVTDGSAKAFTTVDFTINGRNDPPDLSPDPGPHAVAKLRIRPEILSAARTRWRADLQRSRAQPDSHGRSAFFRSAEWSGGDTIPAETLAKIQETDLLSSALRAFIERRQQRKRCRKGQMDLHAR